MILSKAVIEEIQKLVNDIRSENNIRNEIIRDDVFSILQNYDCVVLYYPLDDENEDGCAGCHIEKPVGDNIEQFVFINTSNTRERQAFSVAHELGHIWKVDKRLKEKLPEENFDAEDIVNRFAAELLMPEELFIHEINTYIEKVGYKGPIMQEKEMVKMIAYLMNYFFVPYKSVVLRLNELKRLDNKYNETVLKYKDSNYLAEIIKAEQYTRLGIVNRLKSMDNLQDYLLEAENLNLINDNKLKNIRDDFEIQYIDNISSIEIQF